MQEAMKIVGALFLVAVTAGYGFGQAAVAEATPEAKKTTTMEKKTLDGIVKKMVKRFGPANLTEEQLAQLPELIKPKVAAFLEARKAVDATLTTEQAEGLKEANRKIKGDGLKGKATREATKAALDSLGFSDDARQAYDAAKANVVKINQEVTGLVTGILTDEQKAAMPSKGKGNKGKGKGKKNASGE